MRLILILCSFVILCGCSDHTAKTNWQQLCNMKGKNNYAEQLKLLEWFYANDIREANHHITTYWGLWAHWVELAQKYQPAYDALIRVRDQMVERFSKKRDMSLAKDIFKLNKLLNQEQVSIQMYDRLIDDSNPLFREALYQIAMETLWQYKRYDLIMKATGDPRKKYEEKILPKQKKLVNDSEFMRNIYVSDCVILRDTARFLKHDEDAKWIEHNAIFYGNTQKYKDALL